MCNIVMLNDDGRCLKNVSDFHYFSFYKRTNIYGEHIFSTY